MLRLWCLQAKHSQQWHGGPPNPRFERLEWSKAESHDQDKSLHVPQCAQTGIPVAGAPKQVTSSHFSAF